MAQQGTAKLLSFLGGWGGSCGSVETLQTDSKRLEILAPTVLMLKCPWAIHGTFVVPKDGSSYPLVHEPQRE